MKFVKIAAALLLLCCGLISAPARSDAHMTWTLEPLDFDGSLGITMTVTQLQLGGTQCPCTKVPYVADAMPWNVDKGADNINALITHGIIKAGDTVMGFSLGTQTVSLYLSEYKPPAGIKFLLVGDTFVRNQQLLNSGVNKLVGTGGVPWNITNQVTMVANEFDGYSDQPDLTNASGYQMATSNAWTGTQYVHNYANARLDNPNNVVVHRGNITAILIPNQQLPMNNWLRMIGDTAGADAADTKNRAEIEAAYSGPRPTPEQLSAAAAEQVPVPAPAYRQTAEPAATIPGN